MTDQPKTTVPEPAPLSGLPARIESAKAAEAVLDSIREDWLDKRFINPYATLADIAEDGWGIAFGDSGGWFFERPIDGGRRTERRMIPDWMVEMFHQAEEAGARAVQAELQRALGGSIPWTYRPSLPKAEDPE